MLSSSSFAQNCVASLKALVMANDVTTSKSLCRLSWKPHGGKALAVPVESEVKIYERLTWKPKWSLKDEYHQKVNQSHICDWTCKNRPPEHKEIINFLSALS